MSLRFCFHTILVFKFQKFSKISIKMKRNYKRKSDESVKNTANNLDIDKNEEINETTVKKLDLSRYKFSPKKLTTNPPQIESTKRKEHITIEADDSGELGPKNWEIILDNIRKMRLDSDAPVDTMGADQCQDKTADPPVYRYQVLLSLMLSSQTRDEITFAAMERLRNHGATIENILNTPDEKLDELIYPVGFRKNKVKFIKRTSEILKNQYNNDIPNTLGDLLKLPGVGPKMAHLCMQIAWNQCTGIAVDTHVHRVSNRLNFVQTKTPEQTQKRLESWLPKDQWTDFNHLLVGFGQQICLPIKPKCEICLNRSICPFKPNKKK